MWRENQFRPPEILKEVNKLDILFHTVIIKHGLNQKSPLVDGVAEFRPPATREQ